MIEKGEMVRPFLALDVATRHLVGVGGQAFVAILVPEVGGVAGVGEVGLGMSMSVVERVRRLQLDGEPLVVVAGGALQFVKAGECGRGDCVQLALDALTGAREVEEEGDAVGSTHERVVECGSVVANEDGVSGADQVLQEAVVGEPSLQGPVREHHHPAFSLVRNPHSFNSFFTYVLIYIKSEMEWQHDTSCLFPFYLYSEWAVGYWAGALE